MMTSTHTETNATVPMTVMVVDDNAIFREFVESLLMRLGFNALSASDGQQCLETLGSTRVDLVLTDIFMPAMDGIELMKHINAEYSHIPVIGMTGDFGRVKRPYLRVMEALGAKAVLAKPFSSEELVSVLKEIIGQLPAAHPASS